jgi:hypothetical protein
MADDRHDRNQELAEMTPTPSERLAGRFMRAPDHDAGTGDAAGSGSADSDASGGSDAQGGAADRALTETTPLTPLSSKRPVPQPAVETMAKEATRTAADAGDGATPKAADGPPETYELAPVKIAGEDGAEIEVEIDQALLAEATPFFKEAGLSNEQANQLAPLALKVQERILAKQADDFAALRTDWAKEAKKDKEIGGKNWAETESLAAKALDTFGAGEGSEFRKLLTESGFGDHPEMIRMFRKIGEKLGEDSAIRSGERRRDSENRSGAYFVSERSTEGRSEAIVNRTPTP